MKYRLLYLLLLTLSQYSHADVEDSDLLYKAFYLGEINRIEEYKKEGSQLASLYLSYVQNDIIVNEECDRYRGFKDKYYCLHFRYSSNMKNINYSGATTELHKLVGLVSNIEEYIGIHESANEKLELLTFLVKPYISDVRQSSYIVAENFNIRLNINNLDTVFLIDTGAEFSAAKDEFFPEKSRKKMIAQSFTGEKESFTYAYLNVDEQKELFFIKNNNQNLLGRNYYKRFYGIQYKNESLGIDKVSLYDDGDNIFFRGFFNFKSKSYDNINYCVDTGSIKSIITPKLYKKIRMDLQEIEISQLNTNEFTGSKSSLGKIVPESKISINNQEYDLKNTPAYFRSVRVDLCDLILGQDFLAESLVKIDFKNNLISFTPSIKIK